MQQSDPSRDSNSTCTLGREHECKWGESGDLSMEEEAFADSTIQGPYGDARAGQRLNALRDTHHCVLAQLHLWGVGMEPTSCAPTDMQCRGVHSRAAHACAASSSTWTRTRASMAL